MAKRFFYVCAGLFLLALSYHLGSSNAAGQAAHVLQGGRLEQMIMLVAVTTAFMFLGLERMPYGFYSILRVWTSLTAAYGFTRARTSAATVWMWIYAALAVTYNPVLPLKLGNKDVWTAVNVVSLILFWSGAFTLRRRATWP